MRFPYIRSEENFNDVFTRRFSLFGEEMVIPSARALWVGRFLV
jgi:hypothetical protein